ncbi:MAG: glycosyltransferase [Bacteroidota bacterium]
MIPKKIHCIWISENPIPEKFVKYIASWKTVMPDYEIVEITLQNIKRSPFVDKAIAIKNYALAGHYARVEELYLNGGIYLDLDVEVIRRFTPFLNQDLVLGAESKWWINNAVIVAKKGHPFLKECLDYMDNFPFDTKKIELATGPVMFTNLMKARGWSPGSTGKFGDINILPRQCFYPYHYDEFYTPECIQVNTFSVHHWANSWNNKVSIIIPCYNQARFLPDAINSALAQTHKDVEIIVVNDGSLDNTSVIARKFPSVTLVEQKNKGLSAARNAGIKRASGGWIITLDADDKLHPEFIEKTIGKNDIVCTRLETFGAEHKTWMSVLKHPQLSDLLKINHLNCCSLFKKDVWTMAGGYDENMRDGYEDWEFWIRAAQAGFNITVIDEALFYYRKRHLPSMFTEAKAKHGTIIQYMSAKHPNNQFKKSI